MKPRLGPRHDRGEEPEQGKKRRRFWKRKGKRAYSPTSPAKARPASLSNATTTGFSRKRACQARKISCTSVSITPAMSELQGWTDLPDDLLHSFVSLLGSFPDLLAFAGTCRSWRAAFASYPSKSAFRILLPPLLILPDVQIRAPHLPSSCNSHKLHTCKVIDSANRKTALSCQIPLECLHMMRFVGSSYGQLIYFCHRDCLIVDVFTGAKVSPPQLPFRESEDTGFYYGMLTAPLASSSSHLLVCMQSGPSGAHSSLLDWPVGSDSWSELRLDDALIIQIVDLNGQFIGMDEHERLYVLRLVPKFDLQLIATVRFLDKLWAWLVVCGDILLMVDHCMDLFSDTPIHYEAYQIDMSTEPATWVEVKKLENYALFIGTDWRSPTFSCVTPGRWGGRSNRLYYPHSTQPHSTQPWILHGMGDEADAVWDPSINLGFAAFIRKLHGQLQALWVYPSMFYDG